MRIPTLIPETKVSMKTKIIDDLEIYKKGNPPIHTEEYRFTFNGKLYSLTYYYEDNKETMKTPLVGQVIFLEDENYMDYVYGAHSDLYENHWTIECSRKIGKGQYEDKVIDEVESDYIENIVKIIDKHLNEHIKNPPTE